MNLGSVHGFVHGFVYGLVHGLVYVLDNKILVSSPVPLERILTGFDWVGAGPWGFGIWDGA